MPLDATQRTALYRCFDSANGLLYVGIAFNPEQRLASHAGTSPWWPLVTRATVEWHATRANAERAEAVAIGAEGPRYNRAGSDTPMNVARDFADFDSMSVGQFRNRLTDVAHAALVRGRITYVTNRGRRVAAVVSVADAEAIEGARSDS